MKKIIICSLLFVLAVTVYAGFDLAGDASAIYDGTIRLHVLAESDSEEDQADKLAVRDALLSEVERLTADLSDKAEGERILRANLEGLQEIALQALAERGTVADVQVTLTTEYYPTREYENLRLPAGEYTSLQVKIGAAEGKNWWCVLFPPLCTSSARAEDAMQETGFSKNQIRLLTEDEDPVYTLRFRIVEQLAQFKQSLKELFR